jgi:hypothetical protein
MANWVGGHEMCVGGFHPGCRELHASELHTRPQQAGQAEVKVFLAADQTSNPVVEAAAVSLTTSGRRSTLVRMRMAAALVQTWALAELVRTRLKRGWCGGADANRKNKMSLSFLFFLFYFLEKPCIPMRGAGLWVSPQPS